MLPIDEARLGRAFDLAELAIGVSEPNPRVGCVIGDEHSVFGEGSTQAAGQAHAEVVALSHAQSRGREVRGATAWVTLEPCSHFGRTPPCCDALIAAGIRRVVVGSLDPNPRVNGAGVGRLREAGVQVDLADAAHAARSRELNIGFFARMSRGRSWVRLKVACSLDGQVALADGTSQWITGPEARADGHTWRKRAGAIVSGIGTVLADNPRLDVRLVPTEVQPMRVILDSMGRVPAAASALQPPGRVVLVQQREAPGAFGQDWPAHIERLTVERGPSGLDLVAVLDALAERQVNEVHVEAGPRLNAAFLQAGLIDEILLYQAPVILGPGRPLAALPPSASLGAARRFERISCDPVGPDLRVRLRPRIA